MRLFASIRPPDVVLVHLAAALGAVSLGRGEGPAGRSTGPVRWSPPENWHVTLAFYGEASEGAVPELEQGLATLAEEQAPFGLRLRGAGVFSHRTLWVGVAGDGSAVSRLALGAREVGAAVLGRTEARERSRPHLTVGRVTDDVRAARTRRRPARAAAARGRADDGDPLAAAVRALGVYEGPSWTVEEVRLVRSELGQGRGGAALHVDVASFPLLGAG
nr:RNA 2',3'-cyclic phosphodiesterase [uncultured Actinotalea sp.]